MGRVLKGGRFQWGERKIDIEEGSHVCVYTARYCFLMSRSQGRVTCQLLAALLLSVLFFEETLEHTTVLTD